MSYRCFWSVLAFFLVLPCFVYSQLIDNRDLPPDLLQIRPPFEPTDRSVVAQKDEKIYIILDNADEIRIQDFKDTDTSEAVLIGNVRVRFDGSFLKAEKVIITIKDSQVINVGAYGNIEFTLNNTKYLVESMNYQPDMERGVLYNVRSVANFGGGTEDKPWFYKAEKVTIETPTRYILEDVALSTSDVRFEHFGLKVKKLWYLQGKVALALGLEYLTGQASFFWLPAFLQIESGGRLYTSFGNERRIGYYFINNYALKTKIGDFDFGFDFYERQGQYVQMKYKAPRVGMLEKLNFETSLANDIRIIRNGDFYSQWVEPQFNTAGDYQRISQFSWFYKLEMGIRTNGISFEFHTQDINDPYFIPKYSFRTRFDSAKTINFVNLLSPESWYTYGGDITPQYNSFTRGFSLTAGNFNMKGTWDFIRIEDPNQKRRDPNNPDIGNQFLNSFFQYRIRTMTFPDISYNFGSLDLLKYKYDTDSMVTVYLSDGSTNKMYITKLPMYEQKLKSISNRFIEQRVVLNEAGNQQTNFITNWSTVEITNIVTNAYNWVDINITANARAKFSSQSTFGTNDSSTTTDAGQQDNKWTIIADKNAHEEEGALDMRIAFFDSLWSINNGFKFNYKEVWSSFGSGFENSQRESGFKIDYAVGTAVNPKKIWNDDEWYRSSIGFESSVNYTYPLYQLFRIQTESIRNSQFTWNNTFKWEWLQWQRQPILGMDIKANWIFRNRFPTQEQEASLENDIYINNRTHDQLTLGISGRLFWFNIGTEATIDILETRTNQDLSYFQPILGSSFTNKLISGYPQLTVSFTPDGKYPYIPKLIYRYNLFEESRRIVYTNQSGDIVPTVLRADKSYNLEFVWDVRLKNYQIPALYPFIYELSEFGFVLQYYQDFVNIRNSFLRLDFVIGLKFTKYLTFRFSSQMLNNKIYLYYGQVYNGQQILSPEESFKPFFQDLWDGLQFWDPEALRRSNFKLQSLNFELIHDLDTWDMRVIFNIGRRVDNIKQVAFWEPFIGVAFTMKGSNAPTIFPEFSRKLVPLEYQ